MQLRGKESVATILTFLLLLSGAQALKLQSVNSAPPSCGVKLCNTRPCQYCTIEKDERGGHHTCCDSQLNPSTESYCHLSNRAEHAKIECQGTDLPTDVDECTGICGEQACQWCDDTGCCTGDVKHTEYCRKQNPTAKIACVGSLSPCGLHEHAGTAICMTSEKQAEPCQYCDSEGCCRPNWDDKHECEKKNPNAAAVCTGQHECSKCCADHYFSDPDIQGTIHDCVQDCIHHRTRSTSRYNAAWCNDRGEEREIKCDICEGSGPKKDTIAGFYCDCENGGYSGDTNNLGFKSCKTEAECLAKGNCKWKPYPCEMVYEFVGGKYPDEECPAAKKYWKTGGEAGGCCKSGSEAAADTHLHGDPHLKNLKGEKFNVIQQGSAPLLKVPSDSAALLKIMGVIAGADKCDRTTFITRLNVSGSWLEKTLVVGVPDQLETDQAFYVTVDQQNVWSPKKGRDLPQWQTYFFPERKQRRAMVFEHENGKFSISELDNSQTSPKAPGVQLHLSIHPNLVLKITRPMHAQGQAHLNLDVNGLRSVSQSVGGLLGTDDYSDWTHQSQDCVNLSRSPMDEIKFFRNFESTPVREEIASASY